MKPKTQKKNMTQETKIPDDWEVKFLNDTDIFSIDYGTRVVRKRDGGSKYDVYGGGGKTFFMDTYNRENQLVVARFAMSEKCTRYVRGKFFLNDSGLTVSIVDKEKLIQEYLNYYFFYLNDYIYSLGRGSAQRNLDIKKFKQIKILYPKSLDEQKRIVKILDEVFAKVERAKEIAEENLKNAQELFESYLQNIFEKKGDDWEEKKLCEVCEIEKKTYNGDEDILFVGMEDIGSGDGVFIGSTAPKKMKARTFAFTENHVLYGRLRPYLNKVLIPNFKGHCSTEIFPILPKGCLDKRFLFYWFINKKTVEKIGKTCTGARMPRANMGEVMDFNFIYSKSLDEQKQIVKKLDELQEKTRRLEAILRSKIAELEKLKKSVLEKAFRGEL